ncbi:10498_t:CDS:2 [Entrophospora sp. SA101]|nr:12313_t:CDS:2 [Entrophospora sp. SA101]CAJ0649923.1 10498_t:CDS:2 [Entrophospora sp. SA101]CAJ0827419.1 8065_t:CDS:2 [Entrophospora sp. SA101]CAJ0832045.1 1739_t:CDS:2 [Entrophospora sp. SA101]
MKFTHHIISQNNKRKQTAGILIPEKALEALNEGQVIATGKVKPGDRVLLPSYGGSTIKVGDNEYTLFRDSELLAKINEK